MEFILSKSDAYFDIFGIMLNFDIANIGLQITK